MARIVIADDHPITSIGTETFIRNLGHHIVGSYSNGVSCLNGILSLAPQIAIVDVNMPGMTGLEVIEKAKQQKSQTHIILLTMHKERSLYLKATELGCQGFLIKDFAHLEMEKCICSVLNNEHFVSEYLSQLEIDAHQAAQEKTLPKFTFSENKVLELVAKQKSNKEVAKLLFITEKTVEAHKRNIAEKLNLPKEKNALLIWALKNFH